MYCQKCGVNIKNKEYRCPLCSSELVAKQDTESIEKTSLFLNPPLKFNNSKIIKYFVSLSIIIILLYFIVQLIYPFHFFGLEYILFGLMITWLLIVILIRKRRNIVKGIIYVLTLFSILSLYFDYTDKKIGWSITFVIPILSISALIAMIVLLRFVNLKVEDYILYLQLATIVGLVPLIFLLLDWVKHPLPSVLSVLFSTIMFIYLYKKYYIEIKKELKKRMHI